MGGEPQDRSDSGNALLREFEELLERHRPMVRSVCQRYLRDAEDVDDAVQETFFKLLDQSRQVNGSVAAWLASVARTTSVDLIRRASGERRRRERWSPTESGALELHAAHEAIRLRLADALLAADPAARDLIVARFFHKIELRTLAAQRSTSVPTMSRRVSDAMGQLAEILRDMGVVAADDLTLAEYFGDPANLTELSDAACSGLRFTPDWQSLACPFPTPHWLARTTQPSAATTSIRVGVFVSYATAMTLGVDGKYPGVYQQVRSSMLMPAPEVQLVGIVEPGTASRGLVESALRDYALVGGLIEATDAEALQSLDVILLGLNYRMTSRIASSIHRAVRGGVGLLNEFSTGQPDDTCDDLIRRELLLSATPIYSYHTPGKCGLKRPATVLRDHSLLPIPKGTVLMVRGCGPAYRPVASAQVIIAQEHVVRPNEYRDHDLGTLPLPGMIVGQLGRGRVIVSHVWPFVTRIGRMKVNQDAFLMEWVRWLAEPQRTRDVRAAAVR